MRSMWCELPVYCLVHVCSVCCYLCVSYVSVLVVLCDMAGCLCCILVYFPVCVFFLFVRCVCMVHVCIVFQLRVCCDYGLASVMFDYEWCVFSLCHM